MICEEVFGKFRVVMEIKNKKVRQCKVLFSENNTHEKIYRKSYRIPSPLNERLKEYLKTGKADFDGIELDFSRVTAFERDVYRALRNVKAGNVVTYKGLAFLSGHPQSQRAVGRALARNPFQLFVP